MTDVVIAGGGVIGCAAAAFLRHQDGGIGVTVVEPDPTSEHAASPRASGGVRQLFSCPENVAMSGYTLEAISDWPEFLVSTPEAPDLGWHQQGYLFVAEPARADVLAANLEVQRAAGADARWLDSDEVGRMFPLIRTDDLGGAVFSPRDGWLDPHAFLTGLRIKAERLGATFVRDRVSGFEVAGRVVRVARLESGSQIPAEAFVNAAGCWAPGLAAALGMPTPVTPMRRFDHYAETPADLSGLPFLKDPGYLAARPEGAGIQAGLVDWKQPRGFDPGDRRLAAGYFTEVVWPALAHRFPALDQLSLRSSWHGFYDVNDLDGNMIIGNWPGQLDNFYIACGFSGHGLMHAPAVGRALSELILGGDYRTIDLTRMGYQRVVDGRPYRERGII